MNNLQINFLRSTTSILINNNYKKLQYIPTRSSFFGLFKEFDNLINFLIRKKHMMFYFSIVPSFYIKTLSLFNSKLEFLFKFCFLNQRLPKNIVIANLGEEWLKNGLACSLVTNYAETYYLSVSFLPIGDNIILRDDHTTSHIHEYDDTKPKDRVYVGADSVKFAQYNLKYLKDLHFKKALELGCGTGVQLINVAHLCDKLVGIDINPRAVEFTSISADFNGIKHKFQVLESDLFENLNKKYDLILANPWFINHEKSGLEEIPDILEKLDEYLNDDGIFSIYFSSYVKDGIDQGLNAITKFSKQLNYNATFYSLGKTIEPEFLKKYKKYGISYINNYYTILNKQGQGKIIVKKPSVFRQIRDVVFLSIQRIIAS
jgi:SAM-dependent methyltransferase